MDSNDHQEMRDFIDDDNGDYEKEMAIERKRKFAAPSYACKLINFCFSYRLAGPSLPKQESAFQPNSTLAKLNRRYLGTQFCLFWF